MGETLQRTSLTGPDHLVVRATAVRFSRLREMRSAVPLLVSACPSSAAWIGDVLRGIAEIPDAVWWLAVPGRHHVSVNPRLPFEERIALALPAVLFDRWLDRLERDDLAFLLRDAPPRIIRADIRRDPLETLLKRPEIRREAAEGVFATHPRQSATPCPAACPST